MGRAQVPVQVPVDPADFTVFDVSHEPDNGNRGHSGDSVLRGPTAS